MIKFQFGDLAVIESSDESEDIGKEVKIIGIENHDWGQDVRVKTDEDKEFWTCASNLS